MQASSKTVLRTALGSFQLQRLPARKKERLQAWNAADELLLNTLFNDHADALSRLEQTQAPVLLVNDRFGALSLSLNQLQLHCWNDSFIAHQAIEHNITLNFDASHPRPKSLRSTEALPCNYDLVLLKLPKSNALLAQQLQVIAGHVHGDTLIIAGGMTKNMQRSTLELFEQYLGEARTSLTVKKARLVYCQTDGAAKPFSEREAEQLCASQYYCEPVDIDLINYANVFSQQRMDIGARAMMEAIRLKAPNQAINIADLGCGNGILGLFALRWINQHDPQKQAPQKRRMTFIDESYMAVSSARQNCERFMAKHGALFDAEFLAADSLANAIPEQLDWILCNPPFHSDNDVGNFFANRMFEHSFHALKQHGQLWVVANRHLPHYKTIQRIFGNHRVIYSNKKFVVVSACKR